jgi:Cysteine-rich CPCC
MCFGVSSGQPTRGEPDRRKASGRCRSRRSHPALQDGRIGDTVERVGVPCPCCGHLVFDEPPGSFDICPICFWEDDIVQLRWPTLSGGANKPSLVEAQQNFARIGAVEERLLRHVREALPTEPVEDGWRPFDPDRDAVEDRVPGRDYGMSYADDRTAYYYWREGFGLDV